MRVLGSIVYLASCFGFCNAQQKSGTTYKLALPDHKGQLQWTVDGFRIIQSSAKPNGREIGLRGKDASGRLIFLGFLFQIPESAPLTSGKCRDGAISQEKTLSPGMQSVSTSETIRPDGLPVSLATYKVSSKDGSTEYVERGFVATGDICGDLAFYSKRPIGDGDTDLKEIFSTYKLDAGYTPRFDDVLLYAQVLYQTQLYKAAAPTF
jgi:hypothetical protein